MPWSIADYVLEQGLWWLGHLGCMDEDCSPKQLLFGKLVKRRPFHGPMKRWFDEVVSNLHALGVEDEWYWLCQDRKQWSELCFNAVDILVQNRGTNTCAANIFSNLGTYYCGCGWCSRDREI